MPWALPGLACVRDLPFFKAADDVLHSILVYIKLAQIRLCDVETATQPPPSEGDRQEGQRIWKVPSVPPRYFPFSRVVITFVDLLHLGARSGDGQMQFLVHLITASSSHEVDMAETLAVVHESEKR
jgi:hypothetical protein